MHLSFHHQLAVSSLPVIGPIKDPFKIDYRQNWQRCELWSVFEDLKNLGARGDSGPYVSLLYFKRNSLISRFDAAICSKVSCAGAEIGWFPIVGDGVRVGGPRETILNHIVRRTG
jgi:hypothetical protein